MHTHYYDHKEHVRIMYYLKQLNAQYVQYMYTHVHVLSINLQGVVNGNIAIRLVCELLFCFVTAECIKPVLVSDRGFQTARP